MNKKRGELNMKGLAVVLIIVLIFIVVRVLAATTTITDVSSATSTLSNVTAENNFTHLTIGDNSIGFINSTNLLLYMPFDTNNNSAGKTYDYSANGNDDTISGGLED